MNAECHLCLVLFILSITNKLFMLSTIMLNAVMLSVVAPWKYILLLVNLMLHALQ
jgi:hypothetical protein